MSIPISSAQTRLFEVEGAIDKLLHIVKLDSSSMIVDEIKYSKKTYLEKFITLERCIIYILFSDKLVKSLTRLFPLLPLFLVEDFG